MITNLKTDEQTMRVNNTLLHSVNTTEYNFSSLYSTYQQSKLCITCGYVSKL